MTKGKYRDAWAPRVREDFERGVPMADLVARSGKDRITIYQAARELGWDREARRAVTRLVPPQPAKRPRTGRPRDWSWAPAIREAYEAGVPMDDLIARAHKSDSTIRSAAKSLGWDMESRRRAILATFYTHVQGDVATCKECGQAKPLASFQRNRATTGVRSTCRACKKTKARRRKGIRPIAEIRAQRAAMRDSKPTGPTQQSLRRQLRTLLGKLFEARCAEAGENAQTIAWRTRYRTDPVFRERQIARTWARKAASGVLRTDGRSLRVVHDDGTLTAEVVQRLFAEASHCPYCTLPMHPRDKTIDHVVPVSRGGAHSIANVVVCCTTCNTRKGTRTPEEWRAGLSVGRGSAVSAGRPLLRSVGSS